MAGEKSGDNRIFQLMTVVITSIVAPITVYLVTNQLVPKASNPAAGQASTVVQATSIAKQVVSNTEGPTLEMPLKATITEPVRVTATAEMTNTQAPGTATSTHTAAPLLTYTASPEPVRPTATHTPPPAGTSPTAIGVVNPQGIIPVGTPVMVNNLALVVEPDELDVESDYLRLKLRIRNLGKSSQSLVYTAGAITIKDNEGKSYAPILGSKKQACKPSALENTKTVEIRPGQEIVLQSVTLKDAGQWCGRNSGTLLPLYQGPIDREARSMLMGFDDLGPFQGFEFEFELK